MPNVTVPNRITISRLWLYHLRREVINIFGKDRFSELNIIPHKASVPKITQFYLHVLTDKHIVQGNVTVHKKHCIHILENLEELVHYAPDFDVMEGTTLLEQLGECAVGLILEDDH